MTKKSNNSNGNGKPPDEPVALPDLSEFVESSIQQFTFPAVGLDGEPELMRVDLDRATLRQLLRETQAGTIQFLVENFPESGDSNWEEIRGRLLREDLMWAQEDVAVEFALQHFERIIYLALGLVSASALAYSFGIADFTLRADFKQAIAQKLIDDNLKRIAVASALITAMSKPALNVGTRNSIDGSCQRGV